MQVSLVLVLAFIAAECAADVTPVYITLPVIPNPPTSLDWRTTSKVWNVPYQQGSCSSCWTFSTTGVFESQYAIVNNLRDDDGTMVHFSKQQLIDCAYKGGLPNNYFSGCSGGGAINGVNYVATVSNGLFKDYPNGYQNQYSAVKMNCTRTSSSDPNEFVTLPIKTWGYINPNKQYNNVPDNTIQAIEAAMVNALQYGPIAVSINYYHINYTATRFLACDNDYATNAALTCTVDHSVMIVGYTPDYWIMRNSYGPDWAAKPSIGWQGGFIKIARGANSCSVLCKPIVAILEGNPYWPSS